MKTTSLLLVILSSLFMLNAQNLEQEIIQYMRTEGYSVSISKYAYLKEGETAYYWKTYYSGNKYVIIGFSEESGVQDIDLYLYDNDGTLLTKDTDSKSVAIIEYSPYVTRDMKVVIKNYDSDYSYTSYKCKFIIFYK